MTGVHAPQPLGVTALLACCAALTDPHLAEESPRLGATLQSIPGVAGLEAVGVEVL